MSDDISSPKRPLLITIFAILQLIAAIICLAAGAISLTGGTALALSGTNAGLAAAGQLVGIVSIIIGIIYLIISIGMFKGWRFIWYLEVIFGIIAILYYAATTVLVFNPVTLIALIITVAIIYYMFRPNVKAFFRI